MKINYLFPAPKGSRIGYLRPLLERRFKKQKRPILPDGVPQDFYDALNFKGMCAIPVLGKKGNPEKWVFIVIDHGGKIEDSRTGEMVTFDSYEEAMENIRDYLKKKGRKQ